MRIGFVKISASMIVMIVALLIIFVPMWFNRFSDTPSSREKIPIPPALLEAATKVDSRVGNLSSSSSSLLLPLSPSLTNITKVFVPTIAQSAQNKRLLVTKTTKTKGMPIKNAMDASQAWLILVGHFSRYQQAENVMKQLASIKLNAIIVRRTYRYSVFIGPVYNRKQADVMLQMINSHFDTNASIIAFTPKQFQSTSLQTDALSPTQQE